MGEGLVYFIWFYLSVTLCDWKPKKKRSIVSINSFIVHKNFINMNKRHESCNKTLRLMLPFMSHKKNRASFIFYMVIKTYLYSG